MGLPSQLRQAVNDTLLQRAQGDVFDTLVAGYGFPRPYVIDRAAWRLACLNGVFGKAGTFGCVFSFLEEALRDFGTAIQVTLGGVGDPTHIFSAADEFLPGHAGLLIRIPDVGLFRIQETDNDGGRATLVALGTKRWNAGNVAAFDAVTVHDARILAFECAELVTGPDDVPDVGEPSVLRVYLYLASNVNVTPPTYMQADASARPVGQPFGGAMLDDASVPGSQTVGPFPLYLVGSEVLQDVALVITRMLMPAGYRLVFQRVEIDLGSWP